MKNIFRTSAVVMGVFMAMSAGAVSADALCPTDIKTVVCCNGQCDVSCDSIMEMIQKCGILPDSRPCTDCCTEKQEVSLPNAKEEVSVPTVQENIPAPVTETPAPVQETGVSEYERKVVELVNEYRVQSGLSPLTINEKLCSVARMKSQDMKDKQYFSHTSPTYGSPFDMMKQFGISYRTAGENIAMGQQTPEAVVAAWMNSEGHRANIMNGSFKEIGVGYVADGSYWTQMFIG